MAREGKPNEKPGYECFSGGLTNRSLSDLRLCRTHKTLRTNPAIIVLNGIVCSAGHRRPGDAMFPMSGRRSVLSPAICIFVLALACGLFQALFTGGFGFGSGWETVAIARELARSGAYANPFRVGPSGATAVIAPLFPVYLASLIRVFGDTPAFALAATAVAVLAQALHAALLLRLSRLFFGAALPGIFAGILSAFAFRLMPQWDASLTACGLLIFLLNATPATRRSSALSGVGAGLLLLTNPSTILITGPWLVYLCRRQKASAIGVAVFAAAIFLVALPWMMRNRSMLGTFSVKDNFGMTAYASNNDCAQSSLAATAAAGCYDAMHPNTSAGELLLLTRLGEAGYDSVRTADTVRWIRAHPDAFLRLTARRFFDFWFPSVSGHLYSSLTIWMATGLSFWGLFLLLRRRVPVFWFLIAVAATYPLLYYVVVSDVRYRYPVLWLSLLCAGYVLADLENRRASKRSGRMRLH
jgi:hypothetical protein